MALGAADNEQRGFRSTSPGLRFAVLSLLSIAMMVADSRGEVLKDVRRVLAATAYPIQVLVDSPAAAGRWLSDSFATRGQLGEENEQLQRRLLEQSARLQRLASLEAENARLRALLESTAKVGDRVLIGEIMSVDMNPFRHRIVVNRGSRDEVFVGQALIDADGVLGQVTRDQIFSAEAILITDIDHALPVEVLRNRQRTIAVGTGRLDRLSLPYLPRNADLRVGDLLVTSGLGGTFPAGYPVGVVKSISSDAGDEFLTVEAEPAANLSRVREVLLIWPGEELPVDGGDALLAESPAGNDGGEPR
jgi:rod shape-determining protein MreC